MWCSRKFYSSRTHFSFLFQGSCNIYWQVLMQVKISNIIQSVQHNYMREGLKRKLVCLFVRRVIATYLLFVWVTPVAKKEGRASRCRIWLDFFFCIFTSSSYHFCGCCNNCHCSNSSSNSGCRSEFSGGFYGIKWTGMPLKGAGVSHSLFLYWITMSQMLRLEQGSTPVVGSSRTTRRESPMKAMEIDSLRFMPPERVPTRLCLWSYMPVSSKILVGKSMKTI